MRTEETRMDDRLEQDRRLLALMAAARSPTR
jgi:hypothetical protein